MKNEYTTHNYEYNCCDGTVTNVYGYKMSGVDDFIDEMNLLIQEVCRLKKENAELKDQIEFDNGPLRDFC
jgi:hypothetical protein